MRLLKITFLFITLLIFSAYPVHAENLKCPATNSSVESTISFYPVIVKGQKTAENNIEVITVYKGYKKQNIPFDSQSVQQSSLEINKPTLILASFKNGKAFFDDCTQFFSGTDFKDASFYASLLAELEVYRASITAKIEAAFPTDWQTSQIHKRQLGERYKNIIDELKQSNDVLQILEFSRQSMQALLSNAEDIPLSPQAEHQRRIRNKNESKIWTTCKHDYEVESIYLPSNLKDLLAKKPNTSIKDNPFTDYRYNPFRDFPYALMKLGEHKAAIYALCASKSEYPSLYLESAKKLNMPEIVNGKMLGKPMFISNLDLSNLFLKKLDLYAAQWNNVDVTEANLTNAKLNHGKFSDVNLSDAILDLSTYDCETEFPDGFDPVEHHMIFDGKDAGCEGKGYPSFNLDGVVIKNFYDEPDNEYDEAKLHIVKLIDGNARSAKLGVVDCFRCSIVNSDFSDTQIALKISEGEIRNTSFRNADLRNSSFPKMDFTNVDFTDADLSNTHLRGTLYDSKTKWPSGFDPVAAGAVKKAE